ncbi:helix-turn-helix domain-containing protein [Allokutzneria sp. A3M-2-11 16]|uniref:PucR family transcriptional regulator n=1 Tax=Allokutzneria sp. A3M-2-11 16 TaxID=2962043 RepID=UPI0020B85847|nr:helix-turn-helix domain-containing protein [Allokutzneria sp. A3M-2-11 16]MCP3798360.1 helix-turn-helix domain-containing protein [Allokutzneria sp. A3M-2-11 16]
MGNKEPFRLGGRPLHERLTEDMPALTESVLAAVTTRVPAYGLMPSEELAGDINRVIAQTLKSFIGMVRTKSLPDEEELAFMRESAARRAEEGIPIEFVLTAYHIGVQVVWESLTPDVRPAEVHDVMAVNSLALRYLELITPAVGAGYLDQHQTIFDDERSARHTLLTALLDGVPADAAASRTGFRLPPCYLVLALSVGSHPDETEPGVDQLVAGRRKLRRLRAELERQVRGPVLSSLTPEGGIALLPHPAPADEVTARDWDRLKRLIADVARAAGAEITAGVAAVAPQEVTAAAKLADEIRAVATASGKPSGTYRLDDVLLEYQLSRPSAARDRLAAMLLPLEGNEELLQTLETYLRRGSRRPTATDLHVHPNTVDYRLRRIAELTGLDPTDLTDIALINAALAARAAQP